MTKKGRRPQEICRACWDYGEEYGKLKCSQNLDYCPFTKLPKEIKNKKTPTPAELIERLNKRT